MSWGGGDGGELIDTSRIRDFDNFSSFLLTRDRLIYSRERVDLSGIVLYIMGCSKVIF